MCGCQTFFIAFPQFWVIALTDECACFAHLFCLSAHRPPFLPIFLLAGMTWQIYSQIRNWLKLPPPARGSGVERGRESSGGSERARLHWHGSSLSPLVLISRWQTSRQSAARLSHGRAIITILSTGTAPAPGAPFVRGMIMNLCWEAGEGSGAFSPQVSNSVLRQAHGWLFFLCAFCKADSSRISTYCTLPDVIRRFVQIIKLAYRNMQHITKAYCANMLVFCSLFLFLWLNQVIAKPLNSIY